MFTYKNLEIMFKMSGNPFNTVFNPKLNYKLRIDSKIHSFKNLEEIWNTWKKKLKNKW